VYAGCNSIDITGDYRAIFLDEGNIVTFVMIGSHSQLYK
jgi:mRNA-degrading endonuclease YafQ of YafQ-DinJ toxin-antitoxin module